LPWDLPFSSSHGRLHSSIYTLAFYEKVIKVKADVAAFLSLIVFHLHNPPVVTWGAVKGAREQGAFILTLDRSPRHFILELGTKRNAVQWSFVP
jgi:hypothetical protein